MWDTDGGWLKATDQTYCKRMKDEDGGKLGAMTSNSLQKTRKHEGDYRLIRCRIETMAG